MALVPVPKDENAAGEAPSEEQDPRMNMEGARNMQELLRLAIQMQDPSGQPARSDGDSPMAPERREWLENAIKGMTTDVLQEIMRDVAVIQDAISALKSGRQAASVEDISRIEAALSGLREFVDNLDYARDFEKIGGFSLLVPLLTEFQSPTIKAATADMIAEIVQNDDYCQSAALAHGFLPPLLRNLTDEAAEEQVRIKSLYALSALIRAHGECLKEFERLDGYSALVLCLSSSSIAKLRLKACFLLSSLVRQNPDSVWVPLFSMGFLDRLVAILHEDEEQNDESHEFILSTLASLANDFPEAKQELITRSEFGFEALLRRRLAAISDKGAQEKEEEEHQEEAAHCRQLLQTCFPEHFSHEGEGDR